MHILLKIIFTDINAMHIYILYLTPQSTLKCILNYSRTFCNDIAGMIHSKTITHTVGFVKLLHFAFEIGYEKTVTRVKCVSIKAWIHKVLQKSKTYKCLATVSMEDICYHECWVYHIWKLSFRNLNGKVVRTMKNWRRTRKMWTYWISEAFKD